MGKIAGVVTDGGSPVEGAIVSLLKYDGIHLGEYLGQKITNASGEYEFINTRLTGTELYHCLVQHANGGKHHALSYPFLTPEASVDPDNFEMGPFKSLGLVVSDVDHAIT